MIYNIDFFRGEYEMLKMKGVKVQLPFLEIEGDWEPNEIQRKAAWEIYIELITRITVVELKEDEGLIREALSSIYSIFSITREILKKYGPEVATSSASTEINLGGIAVSILNKKLRPVLAKWHPLLLDYENHKPKDKSTVEYEKEWQYNAQLRQELNNLRIDMLDYAKLLAEAAGVDSLIY